MSRKECAKIRLTANELRRLQDRRAGSIERCLNAGRLAALAYHEESLCDDGFHGARMFQREESLRRAIERFNDAQAPISEVSDEKTKLI